ncbi:mitochondrial metal transporter [Rhizina undulata]
MGAVGWMLVLRHPLTLVCRRGKSAGVSGGGNCRYILRTTCSRRVSTSASTSLRSLRSSRPKSTTTNVSASPSNPRSSSAAAQSRASASYCRAIPPTAFAGRYFALQTGARPTLPKTAKLASTQQQRDHMGHGHGHHHDTTFLVSKDKTDAGVRITRIGLYVNLIMAISKGLGGWYFNSQALVADAFHSLTDLVSDFMTLATVSIALKKPTERFPNGYGKIESLGSLGVSSLLLIGGLAMGYNSLEHLYAEFFVENASEFLAHAHGHGHSHSHVDLGPNINAAWLAAASIVAKEWLYRSTMKVARERKSSVLASNAVHHRIDSLTAIVALLAIGGSHIFRNATYLDPVGGLIVSLMVISAGLGNTKAALLELADVGLDEEVSEALSESAGKAVLQLGEKLKVRDVGGLKSGQNYLAEFTIEVPRGMTVESLAEIEAAVREAVGREIRGVRKVKVRFVAEGAEAGSEFVEERERGLGCEHGHDHDKSKEL